MSLSRDHHLIELLPAYVNGTLSPQQKSQVEKALAFSVELRRELDHCRQVASLVAVQPALHPSPDAWQKTLAAVRHLPQPARRPAITWHWQPSAGLLSLAVLILLWLVVRPGVLLQWTVNTEGLTAYRLYRAPVGSSDYTLIGELPVQPGLSQYQYTDALLVPGQTYSYVVEGVRNGSRYFVSGAVTAAAGQALPAQIALIFASVMIGYALYLLVQASPQWVPSFRERRLFL